MRDRDYVWCLTHMALDQEEELSRLCPRWEGALNPSFDQERYERLRRGEQP